VNATIEKVVNASGENNAELLENLGAIMIHDFHRSVRDNAG
jgi:hypothetical protein